MKNAGPPLCGIRILDFSWVLAGPYATRLLADFGAEVIKVQPMLPESRDRYSKGFYNTWNRNKLGITVNLNKSEGIEIVKKLVRISDGVLENFSSRVMANFGLDYGQLKKIKPDIIMVSLSIAGHTGPWRTYAGFGPTAQAFSGITGLTAYPGEAPCGIGFSYADHVAALYASLAFLGALEYRRRTGKGQKIDVSETEAMTSLLSEVIVNHTVNGQFAGPEGNKSELAVPYGAYPCLGDDRWCAISVATEEEWDGFKRALGKEPWITDRMFSTSADRQKNREALDRLVQNWTRARLPEEVIVILQQEGVPAGIVQDAAGIVSDIHLKSRGFFIEQEYDTFGKLVSDTSPIRLSDSPSEYCRTAPFPGQDNYYVYGKLLGLTETEINRLRQDNVI